MSSNTFMTRLASYGTRINCWDQGGVLCLQRPMDGVGAISFGQQIGFRWRRPITCLSLTLLLLIELCARLASARFFVRRSLDGLTSRSSPVGPFAEQVNMIEARRSHRCSVFMVG